MTEALATKLAAITKALSELEDVLAEAEGCPDKKVEIQDLLSDAARSLEQVDFDLLD